MKQPPDICRRNLQEVGYILCYYDDNGKIRGGMASSHLESARSSMEDLNRIHNGRKYFVRKFFYYFEPIEDEKK